MPKRKGVGAGAGGERNAKIHKISKTLEPLLLLKEALTEKPI
jgi:hypothetical protein